MEKSLDDYIIELYDDFMVINREQNSNINNFIAQYSLNEYVDNSMRYTKIAGGIFATRLVFPVLWALPIATIAMTFTYSMDTYQYYKTNNMEMFWAHLNPLISIPTVFTGPMGYVPINIGKLYFKADKDSKNFISYYIKTRIAEFFKKDTDEKRENRAYDIFIPS